LLASLGTTVLALLSLVTLRSLTVRSPKFGRSLPAASPYGLSLSVPGSALRVEFLRGDIRSVLRGGTIGSLRIPGLINGAGTRSLSDCCRLLKGSIGGRRLSGGFSSAGMDSGGGVA